MKKSLYLAICVLPLLAAIPVFALHPLITDDTKTLGRGKFEIEFYGEYGIDRYRCNGLFTTGRLHDYTTGLEGVFTFGVIDPIEISLVFPYTTVRTWERKWIDRFGKEPELETLADIIAGERGMVWPRVRSVSSGVGDISAEMKWRIVTGDVFTLALKPVIGIPVGRDDQGFGTGRLGLTCWVIGSIDLMPVIIHFNLAYFRNDNAVNERTDLYHASIAMEAWVVEKHLRLVTNLGFERNPDRASRVHPVFALGGIVFSPHENFDLSLGYKYGVTGPETDHAIMPGITLRW